MSFHNEPSSVLGSSSLAYTTSNNEAVLSKNGAYLLQVVSDGLKIHNLENGSEVSVALSGVRPGGNLAPVAISNDGSIVFVRTWNGLLVDSGSGGLFKVSLDGSHQRLDVDQSGNTFSYQGWSIEGSDVDITPDGSKIVFAIRDTLDHKTWTAQQTNVYVKDLSTGSLIQVDLPSTNGVSVSSSNPRISSDGQRVLFETNLNLDGQFFGTNSSPSISPQTSVYAVSVTSGGVYEKVNKDGANQISSAYGWHAEMSADGSAVVFQTSEQLSADDINSVSDVYFKNLTNGQIRLVSDGSSKGGIYPWISPDGAFVAYKPYSYQVENQGLIWSVVSSKTQVIPGTTELSIGSFPNDSIYALSDNRVLLWSWNQYLADEVDPNANYYLYNYKIPSATVVNDTSKSVATYSLSNNSYSVNEGSTASFTLTTKNLASGTSVPYTLSGVSEADVSGGLSGTAVVNSNGVATITVTLLNDNLTEGAETLTVTAGGASASSVVNDTSKSVATYSLSNNSYSVNEGSAASFTLTTKNLASGTSVPYTLSGVSAADVSGGLSGTAVVNSSGVATISAILLNDKLTEGAETLTVTAGGASASTVVNDTSKSVATYSLSNNSYSVNEGSAASFTLTTKNLASGTAVAYTISGVKAADVIGGKLFGTAVVNASGTATISVALANDTLSEGVETMMVTAQGASASLIVNDTSKGIPTYKLSTANPTVNEGGTASFNLSTTNVLPGSSVSWTLEGLSADDVAGGRTSGSAVISVAGSATIDIPVVADQKTEGAEAFTLRVGNTQAVGTVKDTSISSTDKKTIVTDVPSLVNVRGGKVFLSSTNPEEIVGTNKFDTVSSNLASHKARITKTSLGWSIQNNDDTQDTDTLVAVERVDFSNGQSHAFDVGTNGNAGKTAKMLTVLFGPQALNNPQYVGIGIATLDDGQTYQELITTALSVSGLASSDQLVSALYRNLTGYEGTAFQKKLYIDMLDSGAITSERLIELAGDAAMQIQTNLINLADTGLAYKQSLPLPKPVSYELSSSAPSIDEGGIISISLLTKNLSAGTSVAYTVSGISADDLANASLSGNFVVDGSGLGQIALSVRADQQTEGPETLTLTAGTASIAVSINDVSLVGVSGGEGGGFGDGAGFGGGGGGD